ncbi:MAG: TraR/DksA family transcriptional regulator [Desulfobacteraceae bacterium]|jgi:DnaK suppressor protein
MQEKERTYFEGLLLKKMNETIDSIIDIDSLKVDEYEKQPDPLDQATLNYTRNMTLLLLEKNNIKINGFKEALERIHEGTFGICEGCNERISKKRLKAIPFARFCISCQRENEIRPMEVLC